ALAELETAPPEDAERYQVWLQTGDETLDYRDAAQFYRGCALRWRSWKRRHPKMPNAIRCGCRPATKRSTTVTRR
ncbi:YqiA/YcfP family alpha/beta fold hydrolase, partial [Acinetobacter baumannii]|uniref:YqiA/YcfP family alpha/beta fold hydrolase n=1 Tax=Acinetobacter baumannii TaxID=470 RepID=UPI002AE0155B